MVTTGGTICGGLDTVSRGSVSGHTAWSCGGCTGQGLWSGAGHWGPGLGDHLVWRGQAKPGLRRAPLPFPLIAFLGRSIAGPSQGRADRHQVVLLCL